MLEIIHKDLFKLVIKGMTYGQMPAAYCFENSKTKILFIKPILFKDFHQYIKFNYPETAVSLQKDPSIIDKLKNIFPGTTTSAINCGSLCEDSGFRKNVYKLLSTFAPLYWRSRGAALIDIVGFSKLDSETQVSFRLHLENMKQYSVYFFKQHLNPHLCEAKGIEQDEALEFNTIFTGDGFYLMNKKVGPIYDIFTFALSIIINAFIRSKYDIGIYTAFGVGEVYTFNTMDQYITEQDYNTLSEIKKFDAVGPLLNKLARICSIAKKNQILVSPFQFQGDTTSIQSDDLSSTLELINKHLFVMNDGLLPQIELSPKTRFVSSDKHQFEHEFNNITGTFPVKTTKLIESAKIGLLYDPEREKYDPIRFV